MVSTVSTSKNGGPPIIAGARRPRSLSRPYIGSNWYPLHCPCTSSGRSRHDAHADTEVLSTWAIFILMYMCFVRRRTSIRFFVTHLHIYLPNPLLTHVSRLLSTSIHSGLVLFLASAVFIGFFFGTFLQENPFAG
ncbi:hypothetical protein F4604DRAFT_1047614 [Suillus subluteus]|nr:hypothetical protein F4604DRAFT_1047614 [Suillus subluteus]